MRYILVILGIVILGCGLEAKPPKHPKPKFGKYSHKCPKPRKIINAKYF